MAVILQHVRGDGQVQNYGSTEIIRVGPGGHIYQDVDGVETIAFGEQDDPDPEAVAWTLDSLTLNNPLDTASGGTGNDTYTAGDTLYYATGVAFTKVAIGAQHTVYASTGTAPGWVTNINAAALPTGNVAWNFGANNAVTFQGATITSASTTTRAGLNIPHGAAPSAPNNGDLWSTTGGWFVRTNGATQQFVVGTVGPTQGGTGITTYVLGDLIIGSGADTLTKLAIGATGQIPRVSGGTLAYTTATYPNTATSGRLLYASATNVISTLAGADTTNQLLLFDGSFPVWSANLPYARLPTGTGSWNAGGGTVTMPAMIAGDTFKIVGSVGFFNTAVQTKKTVSGARNNPEGALASLLTQLAAYGLITDSTTAS